MQTVDQELVPLNPEALKVANTYLRTLDAQTTAKDLGLSYDYVSNVLCKKDIKRYIDSAFLEYGFNNRFKLHSAMDDILEKKLEELTETGMSSTKDVADLIALKHKMRVDELKLMIELEKARTPSTAVQVNNNYGYSNLLEKLLNSKEK
jgi:hypothetical protein